MRSLSSEGRRAFFTTGASAGGALVLGISFFGARAGAKGHESAGVFAPDAVIRISRDDRVTLVMSQVEMGQGVYTAIPTLIAEELDVALGQITLEAAPADEKRYANPLLSIQATGGSTSMRAYWMPMRKAGAAARGMLVAVAASRWGVSPDACRTQDGRVHHDPSCRVLRYGALVSDAARLSPPTDPLVKPPSAFRLIGKPVKRLDAPAKVNGSAKYGIDAMPKGVKFAVLMCSPVFGGKVARVDTKEALQVPGVRQVVVLDDLVAVVADHTWAAKQGLEALVVTWNEGAHAHLSSDRLWSDLKAAAKSSGVVAQSHGDALERIKTGHVVEASYELPFLAHAAMEPMNCTVEVKKGACEVWVGTQVMAKAQAIAAKASGLRLDQVTVHNHLIGGGFGRRLEVDGIGKAVRIACHVEGPVKVTWTREEDIQKSLYRSIYRYELAAKLERGRPVAWAHRVVGPSIVSRFIPPAFKNGLDPDATEGAVDLPYAFADFRSDYVRYEPEAIPTCFWRGVGPNGTVFSVESFLDRLAHEAGVDPVTLRRSLIKNCPRARAVLDRAVEASDWGRPIGVRSGRGVSILSAFGSYLACVAEVQVDEDGEVRVRRLSCAVDCGVIINPDTVVAQIQGGMIFGLSAALHGEITIENGRVVQSNFNDYRVLRIDETPIIDVHLIASGEAPGGIGEPGTVCVQPAVANAVYAATGVQLTRMPINRALLARRA